ncbi:MAG TPA: DNA polymerase III subunit delta [Chloroflexi bacterium]|jgi:DNA polymerase-3 subunit delta|nr:DNA polymerase III subunit delta [Chloroflexota bacterium]
MPLILYYGDNALEVQAAAGLVRARFNEVDTSLFDGASVVLSELAQASRTVGLFDPQRLLVVRNIEERLKATRKENAPLEEIREVLASVAPTTTVLLVSGDLDDRSPLLEMVRGLGAEVRSFRLPRRGEQLSRWIVSRGVAHGVTIRREAGDLLAEMLGPDSILLDTEIEKLATYAGDSSTVTAEAVETLVGAVPQGTIFALVDSVATGNIAKALRLTHQQIEASSSTPVDFVLYLIRMLARQFRILLRIRLGREQGTSKGQLTTQLKLNRYYADQYFKQADRLSRERLARAFEQLATFEHALKSGRIDAAVGVDLLLADLCG